MSYGLIAYGLLLATCYGQGCYFSMQADNRYRALSRLATLQRQAAQLAANFWTGLFWLCLLPVVFFDIFPTNSVATLEFWALLAVKVLIVRKAILRIGGVMACVVDFFSTRQSRLKELNELRQMLQANQQVQTLGDPLV
ncbi:hypothetical protein LAC81_34650 (plasmid) [Ensifer adhaerens]|uniref:hypothetical protein n=1 Tax=Ensifer adhaerens TaxID=106592 RepID=UPI001CBBF4AF|nr:hypothetical protein [Ensifer adhaerens]MBZ7927098.1 hypothetical protein [Ensifer adhaerens]UAX98142.1 hypothetical protein LAC78_35950 [Ensifer adhaerens]UAY05524.1 hypothetical protein LAC80_34655 [Ensifer adhaerens]UAY12902.1 hypothetical protein LAC81_34650 [Ensifer adhaerens]